MKNIWNNTKGDIQDRLERSYDRMHSEWYTADKVFVADGNNWPGDWEGRTILALTSLGKVLNRQPDQLDQMIENLINHVNAKGYLGVIREKETFDEQQISGHSWLLRGLVDYYVWKNDDRVLLVIKNIVNNLMKPTLGYYAHYPMNPDERIVSGQAAGDLTGKQLGYWLTSSDTGCAFIMLDGISKAYELLKDESLEPLIEEMIETYFKMDFVKLSVQTHATLSGLRGVLRYSRIKGDTSMIKRCEDVYAIYLAHGRTENHANYNWFGRPTWTEPCAIVDAFIVSMELAKITGKTMYIEEANYIYYNALTYAQRENGGFGCDVCSGAEGDYVMPGEGIFEAYWCCTMRGANGLGYVLENAIINCDDKIKYHMYFEGSVTLDFDDGSLRLDNIGDFMKEGTYEIDIEENTLSKAKEVMLYKPAWAGTFEVGYMGEKYTETKGGYIVLKIEASAKGKISIEMPITRRMEKTINVNSISGYHKHMQGYMILAQEEGSDELRPLMDFVEVKNDSDRYIPKKILFENEG